MKICPVCDGKMILTNFRIEHIWVCEDCLYKDFRGAETPIEYVKKLKESYIKSIPIMKRIEKKHNIELLTLFLQDFNKLENEQ